MNVKALTGSIILFLTTLTLISTKASIVAIAVLAVSCIVTLIIALVPEELLKELWQGIIR